MSSNKVPYTPPWAALVKAAETRAMSDFRLGEISRCVIVAEAERVALVAEVERLRAVVAAQQVELEEAHEAFDELSREQGGL